MPWLCAVELNGGDQLAAPAYADLVKPSASEDKSSGGDGSSPAEPAAATWCVTKPAPARTQRLLTPMLTLVLSQEAVGSPAAP